MRSACKRCSCEGLLTNIGWEIGSKDLVDRKIMFVIAQLVPVGVSFGCGHLVASTPNCQQLYSTHGSTCAAAGWWRPGG